MGHSHLSKFFVATLFMATTLTIPFTSCAPSITEDNRDPIQLSVRMMWEPADPNLPDWQLLGRWPQDLISGRDGELFLSDEQNARVLHFNTDGELFGIIGRSGGGPGEFTNPVDLAYDLQRDLLWVGERGRGGGKISRFTWRGDQFEFLDTFQARALMIDRSSALTTAVEEDMYWTNGWFFQQEDYQNTLLQLIQTDGTIERSFGDPWEPEWVNRGMASRINECNIVRIEDEHIALVWSNQPKVQIWNMDGTLLVERYFETPEIMRPGPGPVKNEDGREVYYMWFTCADYCEETELLFVGFNVNQEDRFDFYALDPNSLLIAEWYQLPVPQSEEDRIWPSRLVIETTDQTTRFFCIEMYSSGVLVIEPQ